MHFWDKHTKPHIFHLYFLNFWFFSSNVETICKSYVPFAMGLHCHIRLWHLCDSPVLPGIFCIVWFHTFFPFSSLYQLLTAIWLDALQALNPLFTLDFFFAFFVHFVTTFAPSLSFCKSFFSTLNKILLSDSHSIISRFVPHFTSNFSPPCPIYYYTKSFPALTAPSKRIIAPIQFCSLPPMFLYLSFHITSCLFCQMVIPISPQLPDFKVLERFMMVKISVKKAHHCFYCQISWCWSIKILSKCHRV